MKFWGGSGWGAAGRGGEREREIDCLTVEKLHANILIENDEPVSFKMLVY